MKDRIQRVKPILRSDKLDALIVSNPSNIYYLSAFSGADSYCLVTSKADYIITDFRYAQQAKQEAGGFEIITQPGSLFKKISNLIKPFSLKRVGFESHHMAFKEVQEISKGAGKGLFPTFQLIEKARLIKSPDEIKIIANAASIAKGVLADIRKRISKGDKENDIAARIDFISRQRGAELAAFETIVASGPNASMPHARPTSKRIKESEPVIIDLGVRYKGYNSDLTRTHFVGKIDKHFKLIYSIVSTAQAKAIEKVAPGIKISEIDKTARDYISNRGFGKYFGHATGHGIGIDIHELPSVNSKNHTMLKEGMVFSIEPAIYIPGLGGVRIEDMVLVTEEGHEVLTG